MAKSKHNSAKRRKQEREQAQRSRRIQMSLTGIVVVLLGVAMVLAISNSNQVPSDVSERVQRDPFMGAEDAPVTLIEYAAYGCHACKQWHELGVVERLLEEFDGQLKYVYRDLPIIDPPYSQMTAEITECAFDQGVDAYWALHDAIFTRARQGQATQDEIIALGVEEGLDGEALRTCADAGTHRDTVRYDLQRGQQLGLRGTPAWLVNDRVIYDASPDVLRAEIQRALAES